MPSTGDIVRASDFEAIKPQLSIGTVTTGAAGSNASASITGTSPNFKLNLTIPRGNTGATGATGPQGPSGAATVTLKGSRTSGGEWTLTGLTVRKPLYILLGGNQLTESIIVSIVARTGTNEAVPSPSSAFVRLAYAERTHSDTMRGNVYIVIPTASTVTFLITDMNNSNGTLRAYQ